jgi:hypothetical protein
VEGACTLYTRYLLQIGLSIMPCRIAAHARYRVSDRLALGVNMSTIAAFGYHGSRLPCRICHFFQREDAIALAKCPILVHSKHKYTTHGLPYGSTSVVYVDGLHTLSLPLAVSTRVCSYKM